MILDGKSIILKTLLAAASALPISGPNEAAFPAYIDPIKIAKIAAKTSLEFIVGRPVSGSTDKLIILPPE